VKNKKKNTGFFKSLLSYYKVVVSSEDTFEERLSFRGTKINAIIVLFVYSVILISFTAAILFFTSLRELVPGYPSKELSNQIIFQAQTIESLEEQIQLNDQFMRSLKDVLLGKTNGIITKDSFKFEQSKTKNFVPESISASIEDSLLRSYVEKQDRFNLTKNELVIENKMFFTPIKGEITQAFNANDNHYAIDISADIGTPVKSILDGKIIFSEWSIETGYVIIIDHGDNIISVYKHNSKLLKSQNDFVQAGEVIAESGNDGSLSTGPHLHFELWKYGTPINPQPLLNFE
tara:strand:- start:1650 stop:2519 length:870 start_codon:yes stop_codon:yes gene_type:complete